VVKNLGSHGSVSMELLFEAKPDIIIASANTKAQVELLGTFEKAGIPILYFSVNSFEDYMRMMEKISAIFVESISVLRFPAQLQPKDMRSR
jgi:iron complex transport system substrate-binding protein